MATHQKIKFNKTIGKINDNQESIWGGIAMVTSPTDTCGIVCVHWVLYVAAPPLCVLFGVSEGRRSQLSPPAEEDL